VWKGGHIPRQQQGHSSSTKGGYNHSSSSSSRQSSSVCAHIVAAVTLLLVLCVVRVTHLVCLHTSSCARMCVALPLSSGAAAYAPAQSFLWQGPVCYSCLFVHTCLCTADSMPAGLTAGGAGCVRGTVHALCCACSRRTKSANLQQSAASLGCGVGCLEQRARLELCRMLTVKKNRSQAAVFLPAGLGRRRTA
jgi:hypothetical protein